MDATGAVVKVRWIGKDFVVDYGSSQSRAVRIVDYFRPERVFKVVWCIAKGSSKGFLNKMM